MSMATPAATEPQHYLNYIGGEWKPSISGQTFDNINPAHREPDRGTIPALDRSRYRCGDRGGGSRHFPAWRALPAPTRGGIILKAALILERERDRIAQPDDPGNGQASQRDSGRSANGD